MSAGASPRQLTFGAVLSGALLLKVALLAILYLAAANEPGDPSYQAPREGDANDLVWYLARGFDANAYQRLAREGYYDTFSRNYPMAFPLCIRAVDAVVGNTQTAAVLVSNLNAVLALAAFYLLARHYARKRGVSPFGALLLFVSCPGWLTFGSVAYSESTYLVFALFAWVAYLRAEADSTSPRRLPWLLLASVLVAASVMTRHIGAPFFLALGLVELLRIVRAGSGSAAGAGGGAGGITRGRAFGEACCALWAGIPVAAYFLWKMSEHGLNELQEEIWQMRFSFLGGPGSLIDLGIGTQYIALIYLSLPLVLALCVKLRAVDARLALVSVLLLLLALSYTGLAAQSSTRYMWAIWPLALGGLELRDRALTWGLAGVLFGLSVWTGVGHVLGTAAL